MRPFLRGWRLGASTDGAGLLRTVVFFRASFGVGITLTARKGPVRPVGGLGRRTGGTARLPNGGLFPTGRRLKAWLLALGGGVVDFPPKKRKSLTYPGIYKAFVFLAFSLQSEKSWFPGCCCRLCISLDLGGGSPFPDVQFVFTWGATDMLFEVSSEKDCSVKLSWTDTSLMLFFGFSSSRLASVMTNMLIHCEGVFPDTSWTSV